jgi:hypothetical protein
MLKLRHENRQPEELGRVRMPKLWKNENNKVRKMQEARERLRMPELQVSGALIPGDAGEACAGLIVFGYVRCA